MQLQIHPEIELLRKECESLRQRLGDRIAERDKLITTIKPNLEAQYQIEFGVLLLERLDLQVQAQRTRRKIELVRAKLNRNEIPDMLEIESKLDEEFIVWQEKVRELLKKNRWAETHFTNLMSEADSKELHRLYRTLAKKLHPDLNPHLDEAKRELWYQVSRAYEMGDLETMRSLALLVEGESEAISKVDSFSELKNFRDLLIENNEQLLQYLQDLEKIFPFNIRKQILDPVWIQEQKDMLNKQIDMLKIQLAYLKTTMNELLAE